MTNPIRVKPYNLAPVVAVAVFSLSLTAISAVALGLIISGSLESASTVLNSWEGAVALTMCAATGTAFALTCLWGYHRNKLQKQAIQVIQRREQARIDANAAPLLVEETPLTGTSASGSFPQQQAVKLATGMPKFIESVSNVLGAICTKHQGKVTVEQQRLIGEAAGELGTKLPSIDSDDLATFYKMGTFPIPIPILGMQDIENIRVAAGGARTSESANKMHMSAVVSEYLIGLSEMARVLEILGDGTNASRIAQIRTLETELQTIVVRAPTTSETDLKTQLTTFIEKLPNPKTLQTEWNLTEERLGALAAALPTDHRGKKLLPRVLSIAKNFALKMDLSSGCLDSNLDMINRREGEICDKIRKINRCAAPLEYLNDLLKIDDVLVMGQVASKRPQIEAFKRTLQTIIDRIPTDTELQIQEALTAFIATLPSSATFWDIDLSSGSLKAMAKKQPAGSKAKLLIPFVETLLNDVTAKKSLEKMDVAADTIDDARALKPEFKDVMPCLVVRLSHGEVLRLVADQLLPNIKRILEKESIVDMFTAAMQYTMWLQSLLVMPFDQANTLDAPVGFKIRKSVIVNAKGYSSKGTPVVGGGDRKPLIDTVNSISSAPWAILERALGWEYVKREIALGAPPLVSAMLPTLFQLIRPNTDLRNHVLPIISGIVRLQAALITEANKPQFDMAGVLSLFTTHCTNLARQINPK